MTDLTDPDTWWGHYNHCYTARSWRDYRPLLAEIVREAEAPPLVDVGCGLGFLVECARRFGIPCVGLEAAPSAVKLGRERDPLADLRQWTAGTPLPFANASIGVAMLNEFVDHISLEDNAHVFRELHRVLRPGGIVLVKSPSRFNRFDDDLGHISFFSPGEFRAFVESAGFRIVRQPYSLQPYLGQRRPALLAMSALSLVVRRERWAARIDLVARRP